MSGRSVSAAFYAELLRPDELLDTCNDRSSSRAFRRIFIITSSAARSSAATGLVGARLAGAAHVIGVVGHAAVVRAAGVRVLDVQGSAGDLVQLK